jgi:hypothetical protein
MKRFCFPWRREYSRLVGVIYRPVVEVLIQGQAGEWVSVEAYVDSGADISIFPRYIGEDLLGLEVEDGVLIRPMGIARHPLSSWIHSVPVKLGDEGFEVRVAFAETNRVPSLIGRTDFFDRFTVVFDHKERETCFIVD